MKKDNERNQRKNKSKTQYSCIASRAKLSENAYRLLFREGRDAIIIYLLVNSFFLFYTNYSLLILCVLIYPNIYSVSKIPDFFNSRFSEQCVVNFSLAKISNHHFFTNF